MLTGGLYRGEVPAQSMDDFEKTLLMDSIFNFYAGNILMYFSGSLAGWFYTLNLLMISVIP